MLRTCGYASEELQEIAAIERFIRDPTGGLDYGAVSHVVYHLYNWQQFQALLPLVS